MTIYPCNRAVTTKVLNAAGAGTVLSTDVGQYGISDPTRAYGDFLNGILYTQRISDKSGMVQVCAVTGLTATVTIQGRMSSSDSWFDIATISQADWNTDANFSYVKLVTLFPQMQFKSVCSVGSGPISVWITE